MTQERPLHKSPALYPTLPDENPFTVPSFPGSSSSSNIFSGAAFGRPAIPQPDFGLPSFRIVRKPASPIAAPAPLSTRSSTYSTDLSSSTSEDSLSPPADVLSGAQKAKVGHSREFMSSLVDGWSLRQPCQVPTPDPSASEVASWVVRALPLLNEWHPPGRLQKPIFRN